jgi:hypothetical protein
MMELMEPATYALNPRTIELKSPEKWAVGIKGFLQATQTESLKELKTVRPFSM